MRKIVLAASVAALAALSLSACNKTQDQSGGDNTAAAPAANTADNMAAGNMSADNAADTTNTTPPGRGDPTRQ